MPRKVAKLITELESINIKIENALQDHGVYECDVLAAIGQALDELHELNDELDSQMDDE